MLQQIHPALIHFPIALLLCSFAATGFHLRRPDPFAERVAYLALIAGWWGSAVAVGTGLLAAAVEWPYDAAALDWVNAHAIAGIALLLVAGRALLLRKRNPAILARPERKEYLWLLAASGVLVVLAGYLGGHLVYDLKLVGK